MSSQATDLAKLLNDESFVRWIREEADPQSKEKWDRWLLKNPDHQKLKKLARKFVDMPFQVSPVEKQIPEELEKLKETIN